MEHFLNGYKQLDPTTWVYLSSLLTIAIYFKFSRVWSVRNLDLIALVALAPGLQMAQLTDTTQQIGFVWLFCVGGFFLIRLLMDPMMVRRPLLEPNLSPGGLTFIGVSLLIFLMVNVVTKKPTESDLDGARRSDELVSRSGTPEGDASLARHGPGYPLLYLLASIPNKTLVQSDPEAAQDQSGLSVHEATARSMAILSHLAVVIGIVLIGARHFDNVRTGISAAALYLMLPYTALMTAASIMLPRAVGVGRVHLPRPAIASGCWGWPRSDLLPGVPLAVVAGVLLAEGTVPLHAGILDDAVGARGDAGLHVEQLRCVSGADKTDVRLDQPGGGTS
jgi:hypothetical protein